MENPACWKAAELIIDEALEDHRRMISCGAYGASVPALIASRLRAKGLLNDKDDPEIGWARLRANRAARQEANEEDNT